MNNKKLTAAKKGTEYNQKQQIAVGEFCEGRWYVKGH